MRGGQVWSETPRRLGTVVVESARAAGVVVMKNVVVMNVVVVVGAGRDGMERERRGGVEMNITTLYPHHLIPAMAAALLVVVVAVVVAVIEMDWNFPTPLLAYGIDWALAIYVSLSLQ